MGSSDSNALPVLLFVCFYLSFIAVMYGVIDLNMEVTQDDYSIDPFYEHDGETSSSDTFLGTFITNFEILGVWNLLIFAPFIIAIGYILMVLLIPGWL